MGTGMKLLAQRRITDAKVLSATNEAGLVVEQLAPAAGNKGSMTFLAVGDLESAIQTKVVLTAGGNKGSATYKFSDDAGSTYYGDNDAWVVQNIVTDPVGPLYPSRLVPVDTTGDGLPDTVFCAIVATSFGPQVELYKTTDMLLTGSWSLALSDISDYASANINEPGGGWAPHLLFDPTINRMFVLFGNSAAAGNTVTVTYSDDFGVTWSTPTEMSTTGYYFDAILLQKSDGTRVIQTVHATTTNILGVNYSTGDPSVEIDSLFTMVTGGNNKSYPAITVEADGKVVILYVDTTAGAIAGIETDVAGSATTGDYSAYSETLWAADAGDDTPTVTVGNDGMLFAMFEDTGIDFSYFNDTLANWGAAAQAISETGTDSYPQVNNVCGQIVCSFSNRNGSPGSARYSMLRAKVAYGSGHDIITSEAQTGAVALCRPYAKYRYIDNGLFLEVSGTGGSAADQWNSTYYYDYGKTRATQYNPSRPTRSTGDAAEWILTYDMGDNNLIPVDMVAVMFNGHSLVFEMDDDPAFNSDGGSPQSSTTLTFVDETLAAATWGANGNIYKSGAGMSPHEHAGKKVRAGTTGTVYTIADNTDDRLYVAETNLSTLTGEDAQILSGRAWATQTEAIHRYARIKISSQQTFEDYYQLPFVMFGNGLSLTTSDTRKLSTHQAVERYSMKSGKVWRQKHGGQKRIYGVTLTKLSQAGYDQLRAFEEYTDSALTPFVFVPDDTVSTDFRLVFFGKDGTVWDAVRTQVVFEELI